MAILERVPDLQTAGDDRDPVEEISEFMDRNSVSICQEMHKFCDEGEDQHILFYSFAQNFHFLAQLNRDTPQ
jgi:hypothetical protein